MLATFWATYWQNLGEFFFKPSGHTDLQEDAGEHETSALAEMASKPPRQVQQRSLDDLLSLLRRHRSELAALGHSALPLASVKMAELPVINLAAAIGDDFAAKVIDQLHEDAVRSLLRINSA